MRRCGPSRRSTRRRRTIRSPQRRAERRAARCAYSAPRPRRYGARPRRRIAARRLGGARRTRRAPISRASAHAYGGGVEGEAAPAAFAERVAGADAYRPCAGHRREDVLDSDAFAEHRGRLRRRRGALGGRPALYHAEPPIRMQTKVRSLAEEIARVLRGRAANPRWIDGQMRHGYRGAAEIAETVDILFAYAATAGAVAEPAFRPHVRRQLRRRAGAGLSDRANPAAGARHRASASRKRRGAACGNPAATPPRDPAGMRERRMSAADLRKGWCPGALRPMRDRRRPARASAPDRRRPVAGAGARHRRVRRALRQRPDRHHRARQPAIARRAARGPAAAARPAEATRPARRECGGRGGAQHRGEPARRDRSDGAARYRAAGRGRWSRG